MSLTYIATENDMISSNDIPMLFSLEQPTPLK